MLLFKYAGYGLERVVIVKQNGEMGDIRGASLKLISPVIGILNLIVCLRNCAKAWHDHCVHRYHYPRPAWSR